MKQFNQETRKIPALKNGCLCAILAVRRPAREKKTCDYGVHITDDANMMLHRVIVSTSTEADSGSLIGQCSSDSKASEIAVSSSADEANSQDIQKSVYTFS